MILQPKRTKFKKYRKKYLKNLQTTKRSKLCFGEFGLKVLESSRLTARQIESVRQTINRTLRRKCKVWIMVFPHIPVTKKPNENRMGKGKGRISFWCAPVRAGTVLFEISGRASVKKIVSALKKGGAKLPVKTKLITR
jgi:large subunit ribosomal protein L16